MDESYTESDVSLSPTQILERLQILRQLQLMQRGKLNRQHLQFKETSESSSGITEIVSHFSNSTSYNTFRSLLQSSNDISSEVTPRVNMRNQSQIVQNQELMEGVCVLNLSQESQFLLSSPLSHKSQTSSKERETLDELQIHATDSPLNTMCTSSITSINHRGTGGLTKKQLALDDMPILSPKKNFEQLLLEKLTKENGVTKSKSPVKRNEDFNKNKQQFLKKGEGIARFGIKKNTIVIQNTKSLPWNKRSIQKSSTESPLKVSIRNTKNKETKIQHNLEPQSLLSNFQLPTLIKKNMPSNVIQNSKEELQQQVKHSKDKDIHGTISDVPENPQDINESTSELHSLKTIQKHDFPKSKYPLIDSRGKTWAAILTNEQNNFLRQLKQSDYYKNFVSPTKSVVSDISCDETICKLRQERETAEQNMFDLIENKINHESFNLDNSFFNRFLKKNNLEYSGESTPVVMQKCLSQNPDLIHIFPGSKSKIRNENSHSDTETSYSNITDCCSDHCSSVSCCACDKVEKTMSPDRNHKNFKKKKDTEKKYNIENINQKEVDHNKNQDFLVTEDVMKANIVEMNAKLIAASEQLKARIHDLEDEINTFRKQNENLTKLSEEVNQERQKFFDEKAALEQKFNEEKVLAEYYLAEEKDKLSKQKQMYDRYVREVRGRLNKKEKDEVINLKKEISDLKEEIRIKDVKSTSLIAKLRNQIKLMEKEKKELQGEVEKLKKKNIHIQHNNEVTRRLTNIKYLEEINKKLNNMCSKDTRSEVGEDSDIKYKVYEIEKQSRSRKTESTKATIRPLSKAKSVPNLNVTSRYAKYFSQRDTASHIEQNTLNLEQFGMDDNGLNGNEDTVSNISLEDNVSSEDENSLEKIYVERFKDHSPKQKHFVDKTLSKENVKTFFIQNPKSSCAKNSKSPKRTKSPNLNSYDTNINKPKSPVSTLSNKSYPNLPSDSSNLNHSNYSSPNNSYNRSQSPLTAFNHSSSRSATVIHNNHGRDKLLVVTPEPAVSKISLAKTNLNPTESIKFDGSRELRFPNGNVKYISADGKYSKFLYYNGDIKENFYNDGKIKYFYAETKTYHTTHADGLEVLEFPDGQVEKRYKDGSSEIRLPNGSVRYFDPKNKHVREEWRFPDGVTLTVAANGERRIVFSNGQIEVHSQDHKRREFPDGTVKLVYKDGTSETRYASGRVRIKDKHGNLIMDSAPG